MKKELEERLASEFTFMKRDNTEHKVGAGVYQQWGCQCSAGWFNLIEDLCREINAFENSNESPNIVVDQIKEKFGKLRFYYHFNGETTVDVKRKIKTLVQAAEEKSTTICEICGNEGEIRNLSWVRTLCKSCYDEELKKYKSCENKDIFD